MPRNCFIISPIGNPNTDVRKRADLLFTYVLEPPLRKYGYTPLRADMIPVPGLINPEIIRHIVEDDLTIADLSGQNPNVFYELAIRHVIGKPYIQLIAQGEIVPFDLKDVHTIEYSIEVQDIQKVQAKISAQIEYFQSDGRVSSPFTMAMSMMVAEKSQATANELQGISRTLNHLDGVVRELATRTPGAEHDKLIEQIKVKFAEVQGAIATTLDERLKKLESNSASPSQTKSETNPDPNDEFERFKRGLPPSEGHSARTRKTFSVGEYIDRDTRKK